MEPEEGQDGSQQLTATPDMLRALQSLAHGEALRRVQSPYVTAIAVQKPRRMELVIKQAEEEAALLGESAFYSWGSGKDHIQGASVKLANCAIRIWGNAATDLDDVQDTPDAWIFKARCIDHETGYTYTRQFRQSKRSVVHGKHDAERKDDMRFQIGQSKAIRNAVNNFLPEWLTDRMLRCAKASARQGIEQFIKTNGIDKARDGALKRLAGYKVTEDRVLAVLDLQRVGQIEIDDLVRLAGMMRAIESRDISPEEAFPPLEDKTKKTVEDTVAERAAEMLGQDAGETKKPEPAKDAPKKRSQGKKSEPAESPPEEPKQEPPPQEAPPPTEKAREPQAPSWRLVSADEIEAARARSTVHPSTRFREGINAITALSNQDRIRFGSWVIKRATGLESLLTADPAKQYQVVVIAEDLARLESAWIEWQTQIKEGTLSYPS